METTITLTKETAGLGLGIVGGSDTYLVGKLQSLPVHPRRPRGRK